jgi:2-alkyl-3-oxoalkanoate reductase
MRIVVTGGAGMLGGTLTRHFAADGDDVVSVDVRPTDRLPSTVRQVTGDIRDVAAMSAVVRGADAVVHCASALPSYPSALIRPAIVDGTRGVLAAAHRAAVPRVVYISSTSVYGLPAYVPTPEDYHPDPVDTYGAAKLAAEGICQQFRGRGMCIPILRPKTFLGPGRLGLFGILFDWAESGRNFPVLGTGAARIQMLGLADLVRAVGLTLHAPQAHANDTFNVAAAEFGTIREEFQAVLDAAGHGKRVVSLPARPALAVLRLLERARLSPIYGRLQQKLLRDSFVSIDKAADALGFQPSLSNRDAISSAFTWWRGQRAAPSRSTTGSAGRTSQDSWPMGALALAKHMF